MNTAIDLTLHTVGKVAMNSDAEAAAGDKTATLCVQTE